MVLAVKEASGNRDLKIVDLTETCPSVADIRTSSIKLRALCMTGKSFHLGTTKVTVLLIYSPNWLEGTALSFCIVCESMLKFDVSN